MVAYIAFLLGSAMAYSDLNQRQRRFIDAYIDTGIGAEAYRQAGYNDGGSDSVSTCAARLLRNATVAQALAQRQQQIASASLFSLQDKQRVLSEIALANQTNDPVVAIRAIAELNRMEGHYAPTKMQTTTGQVTFIQQIIEQPEEKPVAGETIDQTQ